MNNNFITTKHLKAHLATSVIQMLNVHKNNININCTLNLYTTDIHREKNGSRGIIYRKYETTNIKIFSSLNQKNFPFLRCVHNNRGLSEILKLNNMFW